MDETIAQMIKMLEESVVGIAAGQAEGRVALLSKSFDEFRTSFAPELAKHADAAIELGAHAALQEIEAPLHKGLGTVGRVGNLLGTIANQVQAIQEGRDQYISPGQGFEPDPASDTVSELLDHAVAAIELALRAAVNEHVTLADDDDEDDEETGLRVFAAPAADGDGEDENVVLKAYLPDDLCKFATDPVMLNMQACTLGSQLLLAAGIDQATLAKAFDLAPGVEGLAKDADGVIPGEDPNAVAAGAPAGPDPNDMSAQLEILGRIQAAAIMQTEHCLQLAAGQAGQVLQDPAMDPGMDPGMDPNADPSADPSADPNADPSADPSADPDAGADPSADPDADAGADPDADPDADADPSKKKAPPVAKMAFDPATAELMKGATQVIEQMKKQMEDERAANAALLKGAVATIEHLKTLPVAPKAVLGAVGGLAKDADGRTGGTMLESLAKQFRDCRTEDERQQVRLKASIKSIRPTDVEAMAKSM